MKKLNPVDKVFRNLIENHLYEVSLGILVVAAILIRAMLASETTLSPDYDFYYKSWVDFYRENGIIKGLSSAPGDYYVPFNLIYAFCSLLPCEAWVPLSIIPCICEFVSAYFIYKIFYLLTGRKHHSMFAGVMTLFLPFVIFNGALWKQVDAIYTVFLIISLYMLLKQHYRASIIWYGVAFSFKLQAIVFLPLYLILYINEGYNSYDRVVRDDKRSGFSILEFLWIPVVYLIAGLPEVLCRHGLRATYLAYLYQSQELASEGYGMVSYFPNIYNFGFDDYDELLSSVAVLVLLAVLVIIAIVCHKYKSAIDRSRLIYLAIWTSWTCYMLLPGMHERYDYPMLLILAPYALLGRRQIIWPMVVAITCSFIDYGRILFHTDMIPMQYVSVAYICAYIYVTIDIVRLMRGSDNRVED